MAEPITVEPRPGVTPPPASEPSTPPPAPSSEGVELPDELLRIPAMQAITAGQPGAFSALLTDFEKLPEAKIIAANKDSLMQAGFGLYRSLDGSQGVVFNQLFVSPDEIQAADQAGTLPEIAPPFSDLNAAIAGSGAGNPVMSEGARPTGFKMGAGGVPTAAMPAAAAPPPPAGVQKTLASKRAGNMQPGLPSTGAAPGAGRLLNSILRPVLQVLIYFSFIHEIFLNSGN